MAEARFKSAQERLCQRNFGEQDEGLFTRLECRRNRLKIYLGLARTCHPIEQHGREVPRLHCIHQPIGGGALLFRKCRLMMVRIGRDEGRIKLHRLADQHSGLHHPPNNRLRYASNRNKFTDQALPLTNPLNGLRALGGELFRHALGQPIFNDTRAALKCGC